MQKKLKKRKCKNKSIIFAIESTELHVIDKMKERNIGIDIIKCVAALLITNAHMGLLYGKYSFLATGGSIGDAMFFFCSGFTLFLKPMTGIKHFPNWYKQRINRIYPTVFAVAIIACTFFNSHRTINEIILCRGRWFVPCIMLHYIGIHFIGSYLKDKIKIVMAVILIATGVWFGFIFDVPHFTLYGEFKIRWLFYFAFMLFGAKLGATQHQIESKPKKDFIMLVVCLSAFYGIFISTMRINDIKILQYFSLFPLFGIIYYFYKVCNGKTLTKLYNNKVGNFIIRFIGGLCLEMYLVRYYLVTDKMNNIFPLNIIIMILFIIVVAYLTRCLARTFSQTFKDNPYNWKKVFELN